jgi:hypothetical protein
MGINPLNRVIFRASANTQPTEVSALRALSERIKKSWDASDPQELAQNIVDLKDKISGIQEMTPAIEKIKKVADGYHADFVFPVRIDFRSFSKQIGRMADRILKTNSVAPLEKLSPTQQQEVLRYTRRNG